MSKTSSVTESSATSTSVSLTAPSVRPGSPAPPSGLTAERRRGGGGGGLKKRRVRRQSVTTGSSSKKFSKARLVQPLRSAPSAECPVAGATTRFDRGNCAPTRRAFSTGVRRSSSPSSRSTGTSGSGPGPKSGASGAFGQRSQRLSTSLARAVARSNGSKSLSGINAARAAACRWRSAGSGGVLRSHGSDASSQLVAAYRAVLNIRAFVGASPSTSTARLRSRSSGVGSPCSAARTDPGKAARSTGSKSPARRIENTSARVRRRVCGRPCRSIT